jgi:uncharacterized protein GlcG (DUF336 family)
MKMNTVLSTQILSHHGTSAMLNAAIAAAEASGQPQCIVIVDASGEVLTTFRMTGAKFLSLKSAKAKALTAASINAPSDRIPDHVRPAIAAATEGTVTGLGGGLPIRVDGTLLGGIGIGSGTPEQDIEVAKSALSAIGAETEF